MYEILTAEQVASQATKTPDQFGLVVTATSKAVEYAELELANAQRAHDESPTGKALEVARQNVAKAKSAELTAKDHMLDMMTQYGINKIETDTHRIKVTETPGAVEVKDELALRDYRPQMFKEKLVVTPDKKAIGDAIVRGEIPERMAEIVKKRSIKIDTL
jgi:hypothetical protein